MSNGFHADVEELRYAGKSDLPKALDDLETARRQLIKATEEENTAFRSHNPDLCARALAGWQITAEAMIKLLHDDHENLDLGREAILEIAKRYAAAERDSAEALHKHQR
ncbi:hypothetical protein [Sciscionella marina]|uniref:hypothetical protein n=1 Tax=Sciscionella marina TaxID=508770 RepID=UPI00036AB8BC|nr:hypothetical protein [Sciscionella marina]